MKQGFIKSHFLDSGAFSLRHEVARFQKKTGHSQLDYYESDDFWRYCEKYAKFIKKYKIAIDHYANIDVIGNPELTWRNQQYLEKTYNLKPVPVVHFRTNVDWLKRYIDEDYSFIGLGGLVRNITKSECKEWLDNCFEMICPSPEYLPNVRIHGFGMGRIQFLFRYPWYSVDNTNIEQWGRWGKIVLPRKSNNEYDFQKKYYAIALSERVKSHKATMHTRWLTEREKEIVREWLAYINESKFFKRKLTFESNEEYKAANFFYYQEVLKAVPEWPFPFHQPLKRRRFDI